MGAAVSLLGDWTAFSLGMVIMLLAASATIHIHKVEIGETIANRRWNPHLTFPTAAISILICVAGYAFYRTSHPKPDETAQLLAAIKEGKAPAALQGRLTYANFEAKLYNCPIKPGVAFGTVVMEATQFPLTIVRIEDKPIVQINRVLGNLTLSQLYLFDEQDQVIASIHDNDFWVKPGYHAVQDTASDLTVFGQNEELLLRVMLINSDLLSVEGKFRYHNKLIEIADRQVTAGHLVIRQECFLNSAITVDADQYEVRTEPSPWWAKPFASTPNN